MLEPLQVKRRLARITALLVSIRSIPIQGLPFAGLATSSQGVDEGPLISVCDPLGAPILASTREKFIKSEFIELELLLERHFHSSPNSNLTLSFDNSGQLSLKDTKKKPELHPFWAGRMLLYSFPRSLSAHTLGGPKTSLNTCT